VQNGEICKFYFARVSWGFLFTLDNKKHMTIQKNAIRFPLSY